MKKYALVALIALLAVPFVAFAQQSVSDDFSSLGAWQSASGSWTVQNGRLIQQDATAPLARIDRQLQQSGVFQISFDVRYEGGGYMTQTDLQNGSLHAGFGIQIAEDQPALGKATWGVGKSYLLWLNLDTRATTQTNYPQHFGFRAQVYQSTSDSQMSVMKDLNVDIPTALGTSLQNLMQYVQNNGWLNRNVPINIQIDTNTGRIMVEDPTNPPVWFYFDLPAASLKGAYVSLRTNGLSASFDNFTVK